MKQKRQPVNLRRYHADEFPASITLLKPARKNFMFQVNNKQIARAAKDRAKKSAPDFLEIKDSPNRGLGLFTTAPIPRDTRLLFILLFLSLIFVFVYADNIFFGNNWLWHNVCGFHFLFPSITKVPQYRNFCQVWSSGGGFLHTSRLGPRESQCKATRWATSPQVPTNARLLLEKLQEPHTCPQDCDPSKRSQQ